LDAVLASTEKAATFAEKVIAGLHRTISADLGMARHRYRFPYNYDGEQVSPEERFHRALTTTLDLLRDSADAVWRYSVATREGLEAASQSLVGRAWEAYVQKADAYDAILGALIPRDFRERARGRLAQLAYTEGANGTAALDWGAYLQRLQDRRGQALLGLSTGLAGLDQALAGLRGLNFLAGGPGDGKTALCTSIAASALRAHPDAAVLFLSLDMGKTTLLDRLLCREAGLTYRELLARDLSEDARRRLKVAQGRLSKEVLPRLRIVERQALRAKGGLDAGLLSEHCCRLRAETGAARVLVVLDYLGLIDIRGKGLTPTEADQRRVEMLQEAAGLSRAAGSPDVFLIVSEVRKGDGGRTRLSLDDVLGSTRVAYAADVVLLLERDDRAGGASPGRVALSVTVAKGRDGTARERLRLTFEHDVYRFLEPARPAAGGEATRGGRGREVDPLAVGRKG
jgi:hypothetical protein